MDKKEVKIGSKTFVIHELLAIDFDEIQKEEDTTKRVVDTIKKSADLSDADYSTLTLKERGVIQDAMAILNGWKSEGFQKPNVEKKK